MLTKNQLCAKHKAKFRVYNKKLIIPYKKITSDYNTEMHSKMLCESRDGMANLDFGEAIMKS